jgi:hypothetical protein
MRIMSLEPVMRAACALQNWWWWIPGKRPLHAA